MATLRSRFPPALLLFALPLARAGDFTCGKTPCWIPNGAVRIGAPGQAVVHDDDCHIGWNYCNAAGIGPTCRFCTWDPSIVRISPHSPPCPPCVCAALQKMGITHGKCADMPTPAPTPDLATRLKARLQPVLDELALKYNTSYSVGYRDAHTEVAVVSGIDDHRTGRRVTTSSLYPMGSSTKAWTATAVMQLVERGLVGLDDAVHRHVDPMLKREMGNTLEGLWGDHQITKVTVRDLLQMYGGINDYDDAMLENWTWAHPKEDYTPYMMVRDVSKKFVCAPGTCGRYSSAGYDILGLLLASQLSPDGTWEGYSQLSVIPSHLRHEFNRTLFPIRGPCETYAEEGVVHQYRTMSPSAYTTPHPQLTSKDLMPYSCLNGWTCGNIAAAPKDLASFFYHLLVSRSLVNSSTLDEMMTWRPLYFSPTMSTPYGLGLLNATLPVVSGAREDGELIGHEGQDWGSGAPLAGANMALGFGLALATNSETGMNCSLEKPAYNMVANNEAMCRVFDATLAALGDLGRTKARIPCDRIVPYLSNSTVKYFENLTCASASSSPPAAFLV